METEINGTISDPSVVPCGVPQGSILESLLFLIYVNDAWSRSFLSIHFVCRWLCPIGFRQGCRTYEERLGNELSSYNGMLVDSRLYIHLKKTECILFGMKSKLRHQFRIEWLPFNNYVTLRGGGGVKGCVTSIVKVTLKSVTKGTGVKNCPKKRYVNNFIVERPHVTCVETQVAARQSVLYLRVDLGQSLDVSWLLKLYLKRQFAPRISLEAG